jgi:hypothetical protein
MPRRHRGYSVQACRFPTGSFNLAVVREKEISEQLFMLYDSLIEGGPESVQAMIADMNRDDLEAVLAEAVDHLVEANERAEKEIERFQRRMNERRERSPRAPS